MRQRWRIARVVLAVLVAAQLMGCGAGVVTPLPTHESGGSGELILTDSATAARFSLSVANGVPTLTAVGGAAGGSGSVGLADSLNGERYSLGVNGGSLMLAPAASADAAGADKIELVDTATANKYTLRVLRGALTLGRSSQ